jgi:Flp pilus assembly protein TadB
MNALQDPALLPILAAVAAFGLFCLFAARRSSSAMSSAKPASTSPQLSSRRRLLRMVLVVAAVLVLWRLTDRPALAAALAVLWAGIMWLLRSRAKHRLQMEEESNAIDAIGAASRALRAGIPVSGMLEFLAAESRGRSGLAFREIVQRERLGEDMANAIRHVLLNSPLTALRAFGLTLLSQLESGGNIADTADRLARALIERRRMHRRARTIMAYTRAAATLLAALPAIVVPLLCYLLDEYAQFMLRTSTGNMMLAACACLLVIGTVLIQRLSRLDTAHVGAPVS